MDSAMDEAGGAISKGTVISFDHTEGRAVGGLTRKGLFIRHKGEVEVTAVGAEWFAKAQAQRQEEAQRIIDFARANVPGYKYRK